MHNLWNSEDQRLVEWLKNYILSGHALARPDSSISFYINAYWSKDGMGELLLQADKPAEARKSEAQEKYVGNLEFRNSLERMRLRPISFILRSTVSRLENSRHIFIGESDSVRWAIGKYRENLWGADFMVLPDCSGLQKIFESEANVPHVVHRWRAKLLQD